jgi:hypothetical protein
MSYFSKSEYKFIKFQKSNTANKKYDAILENKKTKKTKKIPFGDKRYEQYQDTTGLGIYTHKDHKDKERRLNYRKRHRTYIKDGYYSAGFFSLNYLW